MVLYSEQLHADNADVSGMCTVFMFKRWRTDQMITNRSHDFTRLSPCRCGRPAVFPSRQHRWAKAEALKGAEQVEAVILGLGFRMNDLRQLVGERHFPSNRPQVVSIHGVLDYGERKKKRKTESIKE